MTENGEKGANLVRLFRFPCRDVENSVVIAIRTTGSNLFAVLHLDVYPDFTAKSPNEIALS